MADKPAYAASPNTGQVLISTANTARDGTGTLGTVWTAGANGSLLERLVIQATVTTTAGMVRLFWDDGTNKYLWMEVPVVAITPSATVVAFRWELQFPDGFPVKNGWVLKAAPHNAESFIVLAAGGDF